MKSILHNDSRDAYVPSNNSRDRIFHAIVANPNCMMVDIVQSTGITNTSNIWYHIHKLDKLDAFIGTGVEIAAIIKRMKEYAASRKQLKAVECRRNVREQKQRKMSEQERIDAVVAKAQPEVHEDARCTIRPNGVKVISLRRTHFVVVAE